MRRVLWVLALALALQPAVAPSALAYPDRVITIVVPNPPGGSSDIIARVLASKLSDALGQPVVVENRPGAGGTIGTQAVAKAKPDGHTLLITSTQHTINPFLFKDINFEPVKSFVPITPLVTVDTALVANLSFPASSMKELVALAKSKPGQLQYASPGNGTLAHLLSEMLNSMAGIKIQHVPYRGVAPALSDVIAGHVHMVFSSLPPVLSHIKEGRLKALGVSASPSTRTSSGIPLISETIPGYSGDFWIGLLTTAGTPAPIVDRINAETIKALNSSDAKEKIQSLGAQIMTMTPAQFTKMLEDDLARWSKVVKETGTALQ